MIGMIRVGSRGSHLAKAMVAEVTAHEKVRMMAQSNYSDRHAKH